MKIMAEQREDDELKELTFTVKVRVQVRADLPEEGLRVEGAELHLVRGEGASKAYPQTRVRWMEFSSILGESDDYTRGLEDERARCTTLAAECHARLLDMWSPARHALDALHAAIRNGRAAPKQPSQPATAAWEAADLEGRMVTLNMLLEEATRLEQLYAERGRTSTSAAAMLLGALGRPFFNVPIRSTHGTCRRKSTKQP